MSCIKQAQAPPPDDGDVDSAYEDDASSTASITSSILQYRTIHGRTYHSETGNAHYWYAGILFMGITSQSPDIAIRAY